MPAATFSARPNIVLVVADTTRADAFRSATAAESQPELAAFAAGGRTYREARSPAPWTPPAHASIFTGLSPAEHGLWGPNLLDASGWPRPAVVRGSLLQRWLPAKLSERGYRTLGISANAWIGPHLGFDAGFDRFLSIRDNPSGRVRQSRAVRLAHHLPNPLADSLRRRRLLANVHRRGQDWGARRSLDVLGEWLAAGDHQPFFAFLNFMEPHWPQHPPADFEGFSAAEARLAVEVLLRYRGTYLPDPHGRQRLRGRDELAMLRRLYLGEVEYLCRRLSELLERLHDTGRLDDTVVVVVADHGEHIGEHGIFGHTGSVHEELLHVPLLVLGPAELVARGVEEARMSTQGLYQAMLAWSECEAATLVHDGPILSEYEGIWHHAGSLRRIDRGWDDPELKATIRVLYHQNWKYVRSTTGREALYDLATDRGETADLVATGPLDLLRMQLADTLAARQPCLIDSGPTSGGRDPGIENELRALGYL